MIEFRQVSKSFKQKKLFHHLNLTLQPNEVTVLLGGNGVGKSTCMNILSGLEQADEGRILYNGREISKKERQKKIGYVPQEIALWEHLTVEQNIQFFKKLKKTAISEEEIKEYCHVLHLTDLTERIDRLSGGTKRKVNLLIGLLHRPEILILDEPTVGIDLKARFEIHRLIKHLKRQCTILMTTHHLDEVEAVADRIFLLGEDPFYKEVILEKQMTFEQL